MTGPLLTIATVLAGLLVLVRCARVAAKVAELDRDLARLDDPGYVAELERQPLIHQRKATP